MKKLNYYMMALASLFITGCQNDEAMFSNNRLNPDVKVEASLECDADSRTALNNENKVVWSLGDRLSVFVGSADAHNTFVLKSGENTTYATFESEGTFSFGTGTESGSSSFANLAYYPHSEELVVVEQEGKYTIDATIPEKQTYVANSFGENASPMVAVSGTMNFAFKNVASMLKVSLKKDVSITSDVTIIKATVTSNANKIAGECCITASAEELPSVEMTDNAASLVTLDCGTGVSLNSETATEFYFVIPPGKYEANDLVLTFYDSSNQYFESPITAQNEFVRSKYLNFNRTFIVSGNASGVDAAQDALNSGSSKVLVTITDTDEEPTLNLPETTSEEPTELSFEKIPADKTVTIQAETEGANVANSLTIKASSTGSNVFNINLPNSTVTLDANGETATYDVVTASTAKNTLIISRNVTVNMLKVKKGNVRVHGKITEILREENLDEVTYIIYEDGAEIPSQLGEGLKAMSAAEWDLRKAITEGGEITLSADVELSNYIEIRDVNVVINLNNHTITHPSTSTAKYKDVFEVYGNAELTINGDGGVIAEDGYSVYATGDSKVYLNGGYYFSPVSAVDARKNAIVTINGGEFKVDGANNSDGDFGQQYTLNLRDKKDNYVGDLSAIIVKGGKFYKYNPAESNSEPEVANFVAAGYSSVQNGDYYEVSKGIKNETALAAAIAAGGEVNLDADITLTLPIIVEKDVKVNLNGHNLTGGVYAESNGIITEGTTDSYVFWVKGGTLTINGEGKVTASEAKYSMAVWANGGKVIINGGNYYNSYASDLIYAKGEGSEVSIYGGTFTASNKNVATEDGTAEEYSALNLSDNSGAKITVYGGKFYKFDPANNKSENPAVSFVAEGYISASSGDGWYIVSESTSSNNGATTETMSVVKW